jgi:tetratricopeptide (TPR) repeat protein
MLRASKQTKLCALFLGCLAPIAAGIEPASDLFHARDLQDVTALDRFIAQAKQVVQSTPHSAQAQYRLALADSLAAEVAMEKHDKRQSEAYAESGIAPARAAVSLDGNNPDFRLLLGRLCGQIIPANPFLGAMKYGQCARDEIDKALQLNNNLALAYVERGVGNYYLPAQMGGGVDVALKDFDRAIAIDPKLAEAYLWKGISLRKAGRNAESRVALEKALQLDPDRLWTKEQLARLPAH